MIARALAWAAVLALPARVEPQSSFEQGVEAYRSGAYAEARERWRATLREDLGRLERSRVYYDLGNAAWRLDEPLEAVACYTAAVRLDPRHGDSWRNLELARAKAGLPPADPGDLGATLERALGSLFPGERRCLALGALLAWALVLGLEMRRGGAVLRRLALAGAALALLACVPWVHDRLRRERSAPVLVVQAGPVPLRSEPLEDRAPIGELAPLEELERVDSLPGWVRVERSGGLRGWVREETLFPLVLAAPGAAEEP